MTDNAFLDSSPAFSPDGTKITLTPDRDGHTIDNKTGTTEIYVMNVDGIGQMRLTNNVMTDRGPAWSPDGSKIAFYQGSDTSSTGTFGVYPIHVMNADRTGDVGITTFGTLYTYDANPNWSPDGRR